jgi:chemotaxis signal transduction protein
MLRGARTGQRAAASKARKLLVFSVGGRRLATRAEEVVGIAPWKETIPIVSRTPFVSALIRQEHVVLPVFDLAGLLRVSVQGRSPLCLTAAHPLGNMVVCIDEEMPVLQTCDASGIQTYQGKDLPTEESYVIGFDEIPIVSLSRLVPGSS